MKLLVLECLAEDLTCDQLLERLDDWMSSLTDEVFEDGTVLHWIEHDVLRDVEVEHLALRTVINEIHDHISSFLVVDVSVSKLGVLVDPVVLDGVLARVEELDDSSDFISLSLRPDLESSVLFKDFLVEEHGDKGV